MCATQRPNWNSSSCGLRVVWYWTIASARVCLVSEFFNSKVSTGSPLMKIAKSSSLPESLLYRTCRVTLNMFFPKASAAAVLPGVGSNL